MQYTIRQVPPSVDRALRERARREDRSLNEVVLEVLAGGLGLSGQREPLRDLSQVVGSWVNDPETEQLLREQRHIDPDDWR